MVSRAQAHDGMSAEHVVNSVVERPADHRDGPFGRHRYTTVRRTSTLPRVALEYGQTWWAFATKASASALGRPGSETARSISRPKPPSERGPMPTVEVTVASAGTFGPPCEATNFIAPMKQAA